MIVYLLNCVASVIELLGMLYCSKQREEFTVTRVIDEVFTLECHGQEVEECRIIAAGSRSKIKILNFS